MAEQRTRAELEAEWWRAWWDADYSWDGLAKRELRGWLVRDGQMTPAENPDADGQQWATLQDYWRDQEGELVSSPDGLKRFTRAHLPLAWEDGSPTGKADWPSGALDELVDAKLAAAAPNGAGPGPDRRALFVGCVLFHAPARKDQHAVYVTCAFVRHALFADARFSSSAHFSEALFADSARFMGVSAAGAKFQHAVFLGSASFEQCEIEGGVQFLSAVVCGSFAFQSVSVSGVADFQACEFRGDVDCGSSRSPTRFGGESTFRKATFGGSASFSGVEFGQTAGFEEVSFGADASFSVCTFHGDANFQGASFAGALRSLGAAFKGPARFDHAAVEGSLNFNGATFEDEASFTGGYFGGLEGSTISFSGAKFLKGFHCGTREFRGLCYFDGAEFTGRLSFGAAVFDKLASFRAIRWPAEARHFSAAFDQTLFHATAVFTDAGFGALAAFDGAALERGVAYDDVMPSEADRVFHHEKRGALLAAAADHEAWRKQQAGYSAASVERGGEKIRTTGRQRRENLSEARSRRLAQLERGCRVLKQAMERAANRTREQQFYRYELMARRAQAATPATERAFSWIYALTSSYGASIGRPFMAALAVTALMAVVYFGLDVGWLDAGGRVMTAPLSIDHDLQRAVSFSASRIFPFGAFEDVSKDWIARYEAAHGSLATLGVRILASVQSTVALTLVFVLGLAVRRKFQIT